MNDLGKVAVIAAIMGAILLVGLIVAPIGGGSDAEPVAVEEKPAQDVTVLQEDTLEMLDPVYSEKAVFQDGTIRIAFDASYTDEGLESRLPFWLHNVSGGVINVLWDRCSIQLPGDNTVKVVSEEALAQLGGPAETISVAPSGDLFDAVIPICEYAWEDDGSWAVSTGVLDAGTFTLVLAIECDQFRPRGLTTGDTCEMETGQMPYGKRIEQICGGREIVYYTFRFVVR